MTEGDGNVSISLSARPALPWHCSLSLLFCGAINLTPSITEYAAGLGRMTRHNGILTSSAQL